MLTRAQSPMRAGLKRWTSVLAFAVLLVLWLIPIGYTMNEAWHRVEALARSNTDSQHWTLSQLQVELLQLRLSLAEARTGGDLEDVRRRFDVFYARSMVLARGEIYADLIGRADLGPRLKALQSELADAAGFVDSPDPVLRAALPELEARVADLHPVVREIALDALSVFSAEADMQRAEIGTLITRLAGTIALFLLLLAAALVLLVRMIRRLETQGQILEATAKQTSDVINSALDAVVLLDGEGRIRDLNGAAERIFGYSREDAIGQLLSDIMVPGFPHIAHPGMERSCDRGLQGIGHERVQMEARRRSGDVFPIELSLSRTRGDTGEIFVAFIRDITLRKRVEADLVAARDAAQAGEKAKTDMLAVMSHEMLTPLNGMLGALDLLKATALDPEQLRYIGMLDTTGQVLLGHVQHGLEMSQLDAGAIRAERVVFPLADLLEDVGEMHHALARARGNQLSTEAGAVAEHVLGDRVRLRQILGNLLGNAVKFTANGHITVAAHRMSDSDMVEFSVSDTGVGVSPQDQERIFEPFFVSDSTHTRDGSGTGLGLAITARLVHLLGGEISVESVPGSGSTFRVRLPLPVVPPEHWPPDVDSDERTPPHAAACRILLVEDDDISREVTRRMLEEDGHSVAVARDGHEAVAATRETRFDVILMDISMPRLDGIAAAQRIRDGTLSRGSRIIALTARLRPEDLAQMQAGGLEEVLAKPLSRADLRRRLAEISPQPQPSRDIDEDPLVDAETCRDLERALGSSAAEEAWGSFLARAEPVMQRLEELTAGAAIDPGDADMVHRLAGTAGVLGARALSRRLAQLEDVLSADGAGSDAPELSAVLACWQATRATRAYSRPP